MTVSCPSRRPTRRLALGPRAALLCVALALGGCSVSGDPIDLRGLRPGSAPNEALACPAGACAAPADFETPAYEVPPEALRAILSEIAASEPRTELVAESAELDQRVYVQRSAVFRFPDTLRVQIVALESGASAILHSKSGFGYWDLGVNRKRVERWLQRLEEAVAASGSPDREPG